MAVGFAWLTNGVTEVPCPPSLSSVFWLLAVVLMLFLCGFKTVLEGSGTEEMPSSQLSWEIFLLFLCSAGVCVRLVFSFFLKCLVAFPGECHLGLGNSSWGVLKKYEINLHDRYRTNQIFYFLCQASCIVFFWEFVHFVYILQFISIRFF